jgi:hypothetical protein
MAQSKFSFLNAISITLACGLFCSLSAQPSQGDPISVRPKSQARLDAIKGKVDGFIVWSSSRSNKHHDLWIMNADGTDAKQLTNSNSVDWFPRVSPDGQRVLYTRSKSGWVPETDAKFAEKWDLWVKDLASGQESKLVENATWGTWRPRGTAVAYARGSKAYLFDLETQKETLLINGDKIKKGTIVQEPNLSPDGKYLAATLRGTSRETGIYNIGKGEWVTTGKGCQIDWYPDGKKVYRMNPTGNGGKAAPSEVLHFNVKDGKPLEKLGIFGVPNEVKLMDLPGGRSHEYFPKLDQKKGEWLVWAATSKGHDHDIYDYELFIWKIGSPVKAATRLTFHTGNDRWPDLYLR